MPSSPSLALIGVAAALGALACVGACAHGAKRLGSADPDAACASEGGECAALRQQVRRLENRVRRLEDGQRRAGGNTGSASGDSQAFAGLPVVKLAPEPGSPTPDRGRADEPGLGETGASTSWTSVGTDGTVAADDSEPSDPAADGEAYSGPQDADESEGSQRRYRLVGSRLVDLTKQKPQSRSGRGSKTRKDKGDPVVAEYKDAMQAYRSGDLSRAESAFAQLSREHPDHDYADNALYWKGEAAYDQAHYADALAAFTDVVERYGGGNKAPDALLKIGLCYGRLGDHANARDVLTQLIAAYPRARASEVARGKLDEFAPRGRR